EYYCSLYYSGAHIF
nr:immunoglobulin light chain junction region [Macaca mulatta]MOW03436.1 immunoglobulin light chain junction region [Macaca mulatta]MOW57838.1 immunoglobulin light chain junction region [Macaca mulatta]